MPMAQMRNLVIPFAEATPLTVSVQQGVRRQVDFSG